MTRTLVARLVPARAGVYYNVSGKNRQEVFDDAVPRLEFAFGGYCRRFGGRLRERESLMTTSGGERDRPSHPRAP
jgi:hypothetical protein